MILTDVREPVWSDISDDQQLFTTPPELESKKKYWTLVIYYYSKIWVARVVIFKENKREVLEKLC